MIALSADSASELFALACATVLDGGKPVAPRGMVTRELLGAHLQLTQPRRRLVYAPPVRVLNVAFAAAETVWILSGSDEEWIYTYNRRLTEFTDDGVLRGAYGPRLRRWGGGLDQLDRARRLLIADPESRRAVIQLYDPGRDRNEHHDVPCTLGYRFYLRDGRLQMHTSMRSQDLWLGFGYDLFAATVLQELMAAWLHADLGEYHLHIDSLHLYEEHLEQADALGVVEPSPVMRALTTAWDEFDDLLGRVVEGQPVDHPGWSEVGEVMHAYRLWKSGDHEDACYIADRINGPLARALCTWFGHLMTGRRS